MMKKKPKKKPKFQPNRYTQECVKNKVLQHLKEPKALCRFPPEVIAKLNKNKKCKKCGHKRSEHANLWKECMYTLRRGVCIYCCLCTRFEE
jgi:hypothetical protein